MSSGQNIQNIETQNSLPPDSSERVSGFSNQEVPEEYVLPIPCGAEICSSSAQHGDVPLNFAFPSEEDTVAQGVPDNPANMVAQGSATPSSQPLMSTCPAQMQSEVLLPSRPMVDNHVTANDPFAEYFSDSPDGQISVPDWIIQKYFRPVVKGYDSMECSDLSGDGNNASTGINKVATATPFLPFDKIIGYNFPEEASIALDLLCEERREGNEAERRYETRKYVLAEVEVGSQVFQALGKNFPHSDGVRFREIIAGAFSVQT